MRLAEQIKEYVKCPQTGSENYGKWGILTSEQRAIINKLCDQCLMFEETADKFGKENTQLKNELKARKQLCDARYAQLKKQDEEIKVLNLALEYIGHELATYEWQGLGKFARSEEMIKAEFMQQAKEELNADKTRK